MKALKIFLLTLAVMMSMTGAWAQATNEVAVSPAATANQWTFAMTDADIELEVEYYTVEELYEMGVELTDNGDGTWTLSETPAFDIELEIKYYKDPNLAWKIGTEDVPTEGVTAYTGFPFTAPTLVNDSNLTVIYQSTNTSVATIGANGTIAILTPGTTIIKAIYPGDDTYQEDTASYQLTVLAPAVLTLASNNSDWGSVTLNTGTTLPEGVIAGETAGTFRVIPGTEVTLDAEATAQHHVAGWKDENQNDLATATYSDYAVTTPSNMFPGTSALTFTVTGDTTAMAMFGINSSDITASVANTTDVRGTVKIDYTDVQGQSQSEGPTTASATVTAQGGSTSTLTAAPADGYHFVKWTNANGDSLSNLTTLSVTSAVDTALVAVFDTTKAELAWSNNEFTGYTLIDFNNWKPTLNNPHNVSVRYGLVEDVNSVKVNQETGYITNSFNVPVIYTQGTYHIYAVHETDQTYYYDSVVYTLNVNWAAMVGILRNIEEGGSNAFLNADADLTHAYSSNNNSMIAYLAPGADFTVEATANEGYHFSKWQTGNNEDGYTDYATTSTVVYTAPATITSMSTIGLKSVFDTNTYVLNLVSADAAMGSVSGSNPAAKHFLNYEIGANPNTGYHFVQWNDGNTNNPRTVSLVSDSTFTASFAPDTFTVTYMNGTAQLKVEKVPYREAIPEYSPSRLGWKFVGWDPALPELMPGENLTTYAQWTCDSVLDVDGNKYPAVQIGSKCWMAENLRTTHYADGRDIANIYDYQTVTSPTVPQHYGFLYDWYDAADVNRPSTRATSPTYTQGVCPTGYHIPTAEEVAVLNAVPATDLRSTTDWIACDNNNSTGFTAYPAGMYNLSLSRYEGIGTETSWWSMMEPNPSTVSTPSGTVTAVSFCTAYYCSTLFIKSYPATYAISVRCVLNE